jgi:two-component system, NtrC family, sensor histidine kinase PilS
MSSEDAEGLKKKIKALIAFRVIFITFFFGSTFFFWGFRKFPYIYSFSYLIVLLYGATIIYALLLGKVRNLVAFAYTQLISDVIFEILLIYFSGGIDSWFSFTLIISILASSIVLNKKAGFITATISSILYGMLINLQFYSVLPVANDSFIEANEYFYKIFIHIIFFYLTAYLSGYLSSRLEKTEQKLEEKNIDIRDLEFFNQEVIESLPSGLFTTDVSGTVLMFNRAAERITGIKRESVIGRRIDSVLPYFKFPFTEGRKEETIIVDGMQKIIGLTISAIAGLAENTKGFIVVFQDLTKIKYLEVEIQQKEKWAAIGELSSNIAHEIRNPLASLKGSIQMLRENSIPENYKDRLMEIALQEMDRLNRIITDFLMYSRPAPPELQKFDIHRLLDDTIELLANAEQDESHGLINKDYSGIVMVNADPQKMRQVFWNLGLNAIEAMPEGGELLISTHDEDTWVEILFKDTGSGIEENTMKKVFYPFFTTKEHGTGLGLAIAYRIIEEHKGSITVESVPGIGTTFKVILPKTDEKR